MIGRILRSIFGGMRRRRHRGHHSSPEAQVARGVARVAKKRL
ncbi:hypothetical protein [Poseidonocella pacifica]|nr:hypothetical protein [Poseidonocella pacifica]